jgi:peptidoglycan hydrolase-like protein with peptidoglycan-binding domain
MKNTYKFLIVSVAFLSLAVAGTAFAEGAFNVSLKYGDTGAEVIKLQNFLVAEGLLKSSSVTGNFFSLTQTAVKEFQKTNGIDQTGFFGPLSRAVANGKLASTEQPKSAGSLISVTGDTDSANVFSASARKVSWQTSTYPANTGVNINLLRKVSDNPASYVLVDKIAIDTKNDGVETWVPKTGQTGSDLYIEVTCSSTAQFKNGCSFTGAPVKAF